VDGSATSTNTLDWAAAFALKLGWQLHIVCSYSEPSMPHIDTHHHHRSFDDTHAEQTARNVLAKAKERVAPLGVKVTAIVAKGDPAGVLVEMSKNYGLAVVGASGRRGVANRLLSSVSSAMPAYSKCPVLVVPHWIARHDDGVAAEIKIPEISRIVVGLDGSKTARDALETAIEQSKLWGADVVAVAGVPVSAAPALLGAPEHSDFQQVLNLVKNRMDTTISAIEAKHPGLKIGKIVLDGTWVVINGG
jgi:nucleotide-binding universal stress UspA family protein